jgi:hypothetical protein
MNRLFGIPNTYCDINENKLKTLLPLSAIKYNIEHDKYTPYIIYEGDENNGQFVVSELRCADVESLREDETGQPQPIQTEKKVTSDQFIHFPPSDLYVNGSCYESKTCIFPCHNKKQIFELIVRQNNVASCVRNVIEHNPLMSSIFDNDLKQNPYVLVSLYDEIGLKTFAISDKAFLCMICRNYSNRFADRSRIMWSYVCEMISAYRDQGKIIYKATKKATVPHQKLTLYPVEIIHGLSEMIRNLEYLKYVQIIHCDRVYKQRNLCDYINMQLSSITL